MNQTDAANVAAHLTRLLDSGVGSDESRASVQRVITHLSAQIARMDQPLFNPAAFPIAHDDRPGAYPAEPGMSLRDYFAAKALPALLDLCRQDCHEGRTYPEHCANNAYEVADAMLKERDKP